MKCWRRTCCDSIMRSTNCFARFWATFFVAPLTNVTGLSLYYQLYLTEIFHLKFGTKLGHYVCMVCQITPVCSVLVPWGRSHGNTTSEHSQTLILPIWPIRAHFTKKEDSVELESRLTWSRTTVCGVGQVEATTVMASTHEIPPLQMFLDSPGRSLL